MIKKVWRFLQRVGEIRHDYHKRQGYNSWY
jgi:hypothetical protein